MFETDNAASLVRFEVETTIPNTKLGLFLGTGTDAEGNPIIELERQPIRLEALASTGNHANGAGGR